MNLRKITAGSIASLLLALVASLAAAGAASASNESATISLKLDPLAGGLYKDVFRPVNYQTAAVISTADAEIQPLKQLNESLPGNVLTFNPDPDMPVCPDDKIGPGTVSVPVPDAIAACPDSIIGNGLATFALAQLTALPRDGVMIAFNGGFQKSGPLKGRPRIKVYSYSYDTGVGVYTEAALSKDGDLDFSIPQLSYDSSVTSINLNIPGETEQLYVASQDLTVTLPPGQDPNYAQARCPKGSWIFGTEFLLGDRDTAGLPVGPTTTLNEQGATPCTGADGKAKFGGLTIKGPGSVKTGKKGSYKVTLKNTGTATAKSVKFAANGKGVSGKASTGNIAPGKSRTVTIKVKFAKSGKIKTTFKATAVKTSARTAAKTVKVK